MNKYLVLLSIIIFSACLDSQGLEDGQGGIEVCLDEIEIAPGQYVCSDYENGENEVIRMGTKSIADEFKNNFPDFCIAEGAAISFINENGDLTEVNIENKVYETLTYRISSSSTVWCLDGEIATTNFFSENFSLELSFLTSLQGGLLAFDESNADEKIFTSFSIKARNENSKQTIFSMDLANFYDEIIEPDTSYIRYHESIQLNNNVYTELYSNENFENITGLVRKEKVYFHPSDGLLGVRDSLGVLWTRQ